MKNTQKCSLHTVYQTEIKWFTERTYTGVKTNDIIPKLMNR